MFGLKKETNYAIQLLRFLAKQKGKFVSLREFSKHSNISFWFLQKIARKLNLARLIKAEQGVKGGYRLNVPADKLNLYKVYEVMEVEKKEGSAYAPSSGFKKADTNPVTEKLNKEIMRILQKVKITIN